MKKQLIIAGLIICTCVSIGICGSGKSGKTISITMDEYVDKMKAGWVGQMAGVGWGGPTEFKFKGVIIPEEKVPTWEPKKINQFWQDDIYVEMTFIQTLEDYGFDVSTRQAGIDFANSGYRLWHANRAGRNNLRRGIAPPDSGHPKFNNHADDIDYQIECDYSGLIAPGMPQIPIELGEKFGRIMNYGDGMYAGQFVGAMYAEAFFEDDIVKIIETALKSIPQESQYAEMVRDVLKWYAEDPKDWQATWKKIEKKYHNNPDYAHNKCSGHGGVNHFSIDAKLNGAYILMGMLYGEGDVDKTIIISTRCGQDSDCNPSNAGGILCTTMSLSKMPDRFKSALNMKGKFSHTRYDFPGLVEVSKKLVRHAVVRCGGKVEKNSDGKEILIIPVKKPVPTELMSVKTPGPIANSKFTHAEMTRIVVPENQSKKIDISDRVEKFAPGWKIKNCSKEMNPGLRTEWGGRKNVLVTHPLAESVPCILTKKVSVAKGKKVKLVLDVAHDPRGDWTLIVKANGKQLTKKKISKDSCKNGWTTVTADLSPMAGNPVKLELINKADNWSFEAAYWSKIAIEQ